MAKTIAMATAANTSASRKRRSRAEPCEDPIPRRPPRRRRPYHTASYVSYLSLAICAISLHASCVQAVFLPFENCLPPEITDSSDPLRLQVVPLFFDARFDTNDPAHTLNVTVYGNVTGQASTGPYPNPNDPSWNDDDDPFGKIVNVSQPNNRYSTIFAKADVLSYHAWETEKEQFCDHIIGGSCPLAPSFDGDPDDASTLSAFGLTHDFYGAYSFSTLATTVWAVSGEQGAPLIACVSANVTPDLGSSISSTLTFLPAICLILSAAATVFASTYSPWGSTDPFKWTSNYGRDQDLLRLVTPGFGDCLHYIQFIVLAGSLSLSYPGFYQPVVSHAGWSSLLFNQSYVSNVPRSPPTVDGLYVPEGDSGLERLSHFIGLGRDTDMWAGFIISLLIITVGVVLLCQLAFAIRWTYQKVARTQSEDLRSKNFPFTAGTAFRIILNYFLLPTIALSLFQLYIAPDSTAGLVAGATILLVLLLVLLSWVSRFIIKARPRLYLFDDLPTVLLFGPLYNTYSDDAASFAVIVLVITTLRGIAIGAVQASGVAQIVVLAICEIVMIIALHAFRPFVAPTSMNVYHILLATARLLTTLMMIAFVPSLGVSEPSKGWVGYVVLLIHAIVLIGAFLLNSIQTIVEVIARLAGAGEARGGLTKVFGKRELSRRNRRNTRDSRASTAAMLGPDSEVKSVQMMGGRSRSLSASSAALLNGRRTSDGRMSGAFEGFSQMGDLSGPGTPGAPSGVFSFVPGAPSSTGGSGTRKSTMGSRMDVNDPYYRPPRPRKPSDLAGMTGTRSRGDSGSWATAERNSRRFEDSPTRVDSREAGEGPSNISPSNRDSITGGPYLRNFIDGSDNNLGEGAQQTDYSVRESDFYYGISRGPALSDTPTRRLRTGPADPTGPVSSAAGWFRSFFGGKRKERGKGFEVVRSTRAPPPLEPLDEDEDGPHEPYRDNPNEDSGLGIVRESEEGGDITTAQRGVEPGSDSDSSSADSDVDYESDSSSSHSQRHVSDVPPFLAPIEAAGAIELPSRFGSHASKASRATRHHSSRRRRNKDPQRAPTIPRRSSRRKSIETGDLLGAPRLSTVRASPSHSPSRSIAISDHSDIAPHTIPPPPAPLQTNNTLLRPDTAGSAVLNGQQHLESGHRIPFAGMGDPSPSPENGASPSPSMRSGASSLYPAGEGLVDSPRNSGVGRGAVATLPTSQAAVSVASGGPRIADTPGRIRADSDARPASIGQVQHNVADSIQPGILTPGAHVASQAEVVRSRSGSSAATKSSAGR